MDNKENLPTTPTSKGDNFCVSTTPVHKLPLKPISPNKQKSGKLTFLESDNLDEHFNLLHTTHEEIQQQLYNIELSSKQTNVDLEQLFDRLKNNNENLNRLLSSVVTYSQEVMTEGNATKADMEKIIQRLDKMKEEGKVGNLEGLMVSLRSESRDEIRAAVKEIESATVTKTQLDFIKQEISKLKDTISTDHGLYLTEQIELNKCIEDQFKTSHREMYLLETTTQQALTNSEEIKLLILRLEHSVRELEHKLPPSDIVDKITAPVLKELQAVSIDAKTTKLLESILESINQWKDLHLSNSSLDAILQKLDNLEKSQSHTNREDVENKFNKLEEKYTLLCKSYTEKYDDYKKLQLKYQDLQEQIANTQIPTTGRESKMENLRNFHRLKIDQIEKNDFISERQRIASTPLVKLRNSNFTNNSDEE